MVERVPEFSAESLCLHQRMVTSGRWCHMTLLDHVTPVEEWQLGCPGRCPCMFSPDWHPSCHPSTGVTWSRRVMWHQRPLVTIPWRRQRYSAKNPGTFSTIIWLCVQNVSSEMFPESKNIHSQKCRIICRWLHIKQVSVLKGSAGLHHNRCTHY